MENVEEFKRNFEKIYDTKIVELIKPFEEKRIKALTLYVLCMIAAVLSIYLWFWCIGKEAILLPALNKELAGYVFTIPFFAGVVFFIIAYHIAKSFEFSLKKKIMPVILQCLSTFQWKENNCIPDEFIRYSELIDNYNSRTDDDKFQGHYKNVLINMCETELGENRGSGKNRTYTVKFQGVLVSLFPEKNYKGTTLIKHRGFFTSKPGNLKEVNLEDVEFEKRFDVYSDDQIEARFVLTTAFMERFKNLQFSFKASKVEASIKKKGILIGISVKKDLFKIGKLYRPVCDYKQFKTMVYEFASILELIDELKLYQNIGM